MSSGPKRDRMSSERVWSEPLLCFVCGCVPPPHEVIPICGDECFEIWMAQKRLEMMK